MRHGFRCGARHSNVITAKTIQTGIPLFGSTILVPSAVICYCLTFLMTDIIGEIWGKKEARTVVFGGFFCRVIATALIWSGKRCPQRIHLQKSTYGMLLGQNAVFVMASMTAYLLS